MIRFFFLIPLVMCLVWWLVLRYNGWTLKQGLKGFQIILVINLTILLFFSLMYWITNL